MVRFLTVLLTMALLGHLAGSSPTLAKEGLRGDGKLRVFNYHLNEFAQIELRRDGQIVAEGLVKSNQLLRSRDNGESVIIDLRLLDLMDHLQDHFQADTIEIISGYRSKAFNEQLKREGHAVSPVSLHIKGAGPGHPY